jgi:putative Mn2+ efflux pump MntP
MKFISIIFLAIALAMDAFAVAIATGISLKTVTIRHRFRLAWHFGLFQSLMPLIGWYLGIRIYSTIEKYDNWIAFGLLTFIGLRMIKAFFSKREIHSTIKDPTKGSSLIFLSISTSIDAFAIGIIMSIMEISILIPVIIIGFVASLFTLIGLEIGHKASSNRYIGQYAQLIGGLILIIIAFNILCKY